MTRLFDLSVGKNHAFLLALQSQGFTLEQVEDVISDPSKAKLVVDALQPVLSFNEFMPLLRSLDEQKALLLRLNGQMPKEQRFPAHWLTKLDTTSHHVQSLEDLEFFFVVLGTLRETWDFNQKLIELTQPGIRDSGFGKDERQLRLDSNAVTYEPGIHYLHINLVDNWRWPRSVRSVDQVRLRASEECKKLAGIEAIGAYGLQNPELLQAQRRGMIPYCDLAGLQQGDNFDQVPHFYWAGGRGEVLFGVGQSDYPNMNSAAPSVWVR